MIRATQAVKNFVRTGFSGSLTYAKESVFSIMDQFTRSSIVHFPEGRSSLP